MQTPATSDVKIIVDQLEEKELNWSVWAGVVAAAMSVIPLSMAIRQSKIETQEEEVVFRQKELKWQIILAALGLGLAAVPAYFSLRKMQLRKQLRS